MRGVHMNFDLRRFFSEHGPLLVGVTALAVAVTAATMPAALKRDASAITMYPAGDGYPPIYETTEKIAPSPCVTELPISSIIERCGIFGITS